MNAPLLELWRSTPWAEVNPNLGRYQSKNVWVANLRSEHGVPPRPNYLKKYRSEFLGSLGAIWVWSLMSGDERDGSKQETQEHHHQEQAGGTVIRGWPWWTMLKSLSKVRKRSWCMIDTGNISWSIFFFWGVTVLKRKALDWCKVFFLENASKGRRII